MHNVTEFLTQHGYVALFLAVLAEQLGLPLPAMPFLIGAGALASLHQLSVLTALGVALLASLLSDWIWFYLGKKQGSSIVRLISKLCRKPEACTPEMQSRQGRGSTRSILISKFVPGLGTITPPLAGMFGLPAGRFFLLDTAAALLWAGAYMSVGWLFSGQLGRVGVILQRFGVLMGVSVAIVLAVYGVKYWRRRPEQIASVPSKEAWTHSRRIHAWLPERPDVIAGFQVSPFEAAAWFASSPTATPRRWPRPPPIGVLQRTHDRDALSLVQHFLQIPFLAPMGLASDFTSALRAAGPSRSEGTRNGSGKEAFRTAPAGNRASCQETIKAAPHGLRKTLNSLPFRQLDAWTRACTWRS